MQGVEQRGVDDGRKGLGKSSGETSEQRGVERGGGGGGDVAFHSCSHVITPSRTLPLCFFLLLPSFSSTSYFSTSSLLLLLLLLWLLLLLLLLLLRDEQGVAERVADVVCKRACRVVIVKPSCNSALGWCIQTG